MRQLKEYFREPQPYVLMIFGGLWFFIGMMFGNGLAHHLWWGGIVGVTFYALCLLWLFLSERSEGPVHYPRPTVNRPARSAQAQNIVDSVVWAGIIFVIVLVALVVANYDRPLYGLRMGMMGLPVGVILGLFQYVTHRP